MNLIIATGIYPPDIGGPATYSKKIAEEFSKRGWDVNVLTYADDIDISPFVKGGVRGIFRSNEIKKLECSNGESFSLGKIPPDPPLGRGGEFNVVKISRNHNVFARYFLYTWKLVKLAKNADLIYAQGTVSEGLPSLVASKLTGKKYVLRIGGDTVWERFSSRKQENKKTTKQFINLEKFQEMKGLPLKTNILRWIQQFVARHAIKIIVPSKCLKKTVSMWGVDEGQIEVIYSAEEEGVREKIKKFTLLDSRHLTWLRNLKIEEGNIILSVGRLLSFKGFDTLIEIMPELWKVNQNFKLVIVGDGPDYRRLKDKINFVNIKKDPSTAVGMTAENAVGMTATNMRGMTDNKIILTGKMEHNEVLQLMKEAKIFVLNSGYEGLSHSVIEAMQAGIPCAVSNVGGNPELTENEKSGLLFEYNNKEQIKDAIIKLWKDEELRKRVVAGGYEKIKEFSFERMIRETMEILNFKF